VGILGKKQFFTPRAKNGGFGRKWEKNPCLVREIRFMVFLFSKSKTSTKTPIYSVVGNCIYFGVYKCPSPLGNRVSSAPVVVFSHPTDITGKTAVTMPVGVEHYHPLPPRKALITFHFLLEIPFFGTSL
jgi:hypothetical protein